MLANDSDLPHRPFASYKVHSRTSFLDQLTRIGRIANLSLNTAKTTRALCRVCSSRISVRSYASASYRALLPRSGLYQSVKPSTRHTSSTNFPLQRRQELHNHTMAAVNGKDAAAAPAQQGQVSAAVAAFKAMEGKETMKLENVSMAFACFCAFHTTDIFADSTLYLHSNDIDCKA